MVKADFGKSETKDSKCKLILAKIFPIFSKATWNVAECHACFSCTIMVGTNSPFGLFSLKIPFVTMQQHPEVRAHLGTMYIFMGIDHSVCDTEK